MICEMLKVKDSKGPNVCNVAFAGFSRPGLRHGPTAKGGGRLLVVVIVVKVIVVISGYARRCVDQSVVRSVYR